MYRDYLGQIHLEEQDVFDQLYQDPEFDITRISMVNPSTFNESNKITHAGFGSIRPAEIAFNISSDRVSSLEEDIRNFDSHLQNIWFMPVEYQNLDIWEHLAQKMSELGEKGEFGQEHLDRVMLEMDLFEERGMVPLLRYLAYLVDTLKKNNVVWGVGRGSSVSSYVLYLLGVHRIDSFKYNLDIREFLK